MAKLAKPCRHCGSELHVSFTCFSVKRKPLRQEATKTKKKRLATREAWLALNPADARGFWYCYLQISPRCPQRLTDQSLVLEHVVSKVRRPDLKYVVSNIRPACGFCNELKMSKDVSEV